MPIRKCYRGLQGRTPRVALVIRNTRAGTKEQKFAHAKPGDRTPPPGFTPFNRARCRAAAARCRTWFYAIDSAGCLKGDRYSRRSSALASESPTICFLVGSYTNGRPFSCAEMLARIQDAVEVWPSSMSATG